MKFEYEISKHPADAFEQIVYFCSDRGECGMEDIQDDQSVALTDLFNARGQKGWELVQAHFGKDGIVAIWKKEII